jgi:hypothetical protein
VPIPVAFRLRDVSDPRHAAVIRSVVDWTPALPAEALDGLLKHHAGGA